MSSELLDKNGGPKNFPKVMMIKVIRELSKFLSRESLDCKKRFKPKLQLVISNAYCKLKEECNKIFKVNGNFARDFGFSKLHHKDFIKSTGARGGGVAQNV